MVVFAGVEIFRLGAKTQRREEKRVAIFAASLSSGIPLSRKQNTERRGC